MRYRASGIGNLMVGEVGLTDKQSERLKELVFEKTTGVNGNGNKVAWTDRKKKELEDLVYKKENPVLSETPKTFILESVIYDRIGIRKEIKSKYLDKGTVQEDLAIEHLSRIDNVSYSKNTERKGFDFVTGECDIVTAEKVIDIKNSWDFFTFFHAGIKPIYEWQGRAYMELWDKPKFELVYFLNDMPLFLFHYEVISMLRKFSNFDVIDEVNELFSFCDLEKGETDVEVVLELQKEYLHCLRQICPSSRLEQLIHSSFFSWIPIEKRVKRFEIVRDNTWQKLVDRMPYVRDFEKECIKRIQHYEIF